MDEIDLKNIDHVLHVLRNPHGWNDHVVRDARLAAADEIERLQGAEEGGDILLEIERERHAETMKAVAYYKAAMRREAPPWVPARVRVVHEVFGDGMMRGAGVAPGEHDCECNRWGAVVVLDRAGTRLGLRPQEFEPVAWRENLTPNV